jgi:Flp pilus assembly protein TadB
MLGGLIGLVTAVTGPLLALFVGSSRRHRRLTEIRAYVEVAAALREQSPEEALLLDELVADLVRDLVNQERKTRDRRFDPGTAAAAALFLTPLIGLVFVWPIDAWWKWILLVVVVLWAILVCVAGWQASFQPREKRANQQNDHAD